MRIVLLKKLNTSENSKPALIIGNGPSVDKLDPMLLQFFNSYGCNHIYKKFNEWNRTTDNVVITDSNRIEEIGKAYQNYQGKLYVGDQRYLYPPVRRLRQHLGRDFIPLRRLAKRTMPVNRFTERIPFPTSLYATVFDHSRVTFSMEEGLNFGPSVISSAIQLAAINGHKKIVLTGVDSHYSTPTSYFKGMVGAISYVNTTFIANPRLYMEPILVLLQVYLEELKIELIDCTPGGALRFIKKGRFCADGNVTIV